MRLIAIALDEGCTKSILCCGAMLKLCEVSASVALDCSIVVVLPE
jgi:hypothetical protein